MDASEYGWGCVLAQRAVPGGAPRPIAAYSRSFSTTESAWSAWERELFAYRESLAATDHLVKGFTMHCFTDHRNNLFTNSLKGNIRLNKKTLRWSLDIEEYGDRVRLHWVRGAENVLADALSRNPPDRDQARQQTMPGGPVKRVMRMMFEKPIQDEVEWQASTALLETLGDQEVDLSAAVSRGRRDKDEPEPPPRRVGNRNGGPGAGAPRAQLPAARTRAGGVYCCRRSCFAGAKAREGCQ